MSPAQNCNLLEEEGEGVGGGLLKALEGREMTSDMDGKKIKKKISLFGPRP